MTQTRAPLRIEAADLRLVRLPLVTPFTISTGTMTEKIFPLLALKADGIEGYAEGVMDPLPDYLEETTSGAMACPGLSWRRCRRLRPAGPRTWPGSSLPSA